MNIIHSRVSLIWKGMALFAMMAVALLLSNALPAAAQTQDQLIISVDDTSLVEGESVIMEFTVRLNKPAPGNLVFYYKIVDGTAQNGSDYHHTVHPSDYIGWPTWVKSGKTEEIIPVAINEDDETEGPETLKLIIVQVDAPAVIGDGEGIGTITDPEPEPERHAIEFSLMTNDSTSEGEDAAFYLLHPHMSAPVTASITITQSGNFAAPGQINTRRVTTRTGNWSQTSFIVATQNDGRDEGNGSITATLNPSPNYGIARGYGSATTIMLDDDEPVVSITPGSAVREGGNALFGLSASPPPAVPTDVNVRVTQSDFFAASGQTGDRVVTIGTNGRGTLSVATEADNVDEEDGEIRATIRAGQGYLIASARSYAAVVVTDGGAPTPQVNISAGSTITEGGVATFALTASPRPASAINVIVDVDESGSFAASGQTGARSVTIGTDGRGSISIATQDDDTIEPDGSITVTVLGGVGYSIAHPDSASVRVRDAGTTKPFVSISAGSAIIEGDEAVFTLSANPPPSSAIEVDVYVTDRGDYVTPRDEGLKIVDVQPDGTGVLRVRTIDDSQDERNGSITVKIRSGRDYAIGSPNSATMQVNDDDVRASARTVSIADAEIRENDRDNWGNMRFEVTLSKPADDWVLVYYETRETDDAFSATEDEDYWNRGGHVLFVPGEETVQHAHVRVLNDDEHEVTETFEVVIVDVIGPAEIADGVATGTILPDPFDAPRDTTTFSIEAEAAVTEGGKATFYITATPPQKEDMTINIIVSEEGDGDFIADDDEGEYSITLHGDYSLVESSVQKFTIDTVNDSVDEANGAITVEIAEPDGDGTDYIVGSPHSASTIVYDNDGAPAALPMIAVTDAMASESAGSIWFSVTLAPPAPEHGKVKVYYTLHSGSADAGDDYVQSHGALVFEGGENIQYVVIPIVDDGDTEDAETFELRLSYPEGATIADEVGVGTIEASD